MKKYLVINRALLSLGVLWFFCHTYFEIGDLVITFKIVIFCHNLQYVGLEPREWLYGWVGGGWSEYTVKKVHEFPVSSRDVTNQTPPGQE